MTAFSPSDAALEGFHVLRRHWRVVVGWAGFNLVGMVAAIVVAAVVVFALVVTGAVSDTTLSGAGSFVAIVGDVLIQAIVAMGLYRMLLRPEAPGFMHLRLGRDELRLLGVGAVCAAGLAVIGAAAYMLGQALAPVARLAPVLTWLAAAVVALWLSLRFGLVGPMIIAEDRIDFARSWRLTRGRNWSLVGMWLLNVCVVLMVWVAWWIAAFVIVGLLTGFGGAGEGADAFIAHPVRYLLEGASPLLFAPVILVLQHTPYVETYKALTEPAVLDAA